MLLTAPGLAFFYGGLARSRVFGVNATGFAGGTAVHINSVGVDLALHGESGHAYPDEAARV